MIYAKINDTASFAGLNERFQMALQFVRDYVKDPKPCGRYDLDGDKVFANVSDYETKPAQGAQAESHRRYADLQFVAKGKEVIGYAPLDTLTVAREEFSKGGDIAFYDGEVTCWLPMGNGEVAFFFPEDGHMPCIQVEAQEAVTKIVVKILL